MTLRFEGSYLGAGAKLSDRARLECKICWWVYDPASGDESRQIEPGTPFAALPADWRCPQCDGERDQFMVMDADGAVADADEADRPTQPGRDPAVYARERGTLIAEAFRDIHANKMRDTPFANRSLTVEAIGFRPHGNHVLGILVVPWFMNLILMPGEGEDWSRFSVGDRRVVAFPSGEYEFVFNRREPAGDYFACSLFSPMGDFTSQLQASDTARAALTALFDRAHHELGDQAGDIRRLREEEIAAEDEVRAAAEAESEPQGSDRPAKAPTRRGFFTAGLAGSGEEVEARTNTTEPAE
ncbi:[NiFe]-hydrogenase assembly chaperone HybE [Jiella marina]|uniref:[NiFe]-hydrogenase assembly chaperone HybE n=1 Tax=Jiella sp. LLJ827 TaxID=2917712 RepID=UPI002101D2BB|nr:[NiFe]-hydrogenase assembly chaperone HybE [Jiella sp. LLJ827]MCQ0988216.1 [NiFe]-hydrogenase assembly chaperone HybE [Jiella sp. LLJ827]